MKKWALIAAVLMLGLLGGLMLLLNRPPAPQRDYIAEYDAMITRRFPDGRAGVRDFEALLALDRHTKIQAIAQASVERAIERAAAEGLRIDLIEVEPMALVVLVPGEEPVRWPEEEAQRVTAERVLREARAEAIPRVLELLMDPAWRSAVAAFGAHDVVIMPTVPGASLFDRLLVHLGPGRENARADAVMVRLSDDEPARLEALRSMLAMARASATSATIIGGLVQVAIEGLAFETILAALAGRGEPIEDPRAWLVELQRHATLRQDMAWHFAGERLGVLDILEAEYTKRPGAMRLNTPTTLPVVGVSHGRMYAILDEYYQAMIDAVSRMPGERSGSVPDPLALIQSVGFRARPLLEVVLPALDRAISNLDRAEAELVGTMAALALAAYHADHGVWPGTLEQLLPEYLEAVPLDPFSPDAAEPLVYRVDTDGTVWLYSRGFDLTDNGGVRPSDPRDRGAGNDLVFLPRGD